LQEGLVISFPDDAVVDDKAGGDECEECHESETSEDKGIDGGKSFHSVNR
jgi:hypothetical protein